MRGRLKLWIRKLDFLEQSIVQDTLWKLLLNDVCLYLESTALDCQLRKDRSGLVKHMPAQIE